MEDLLLSTLEKLGWPVRRQGSLAPGEKYPDTFLTYWCDAENEHAAYDDATALAEHDYSIYVYSTDPRLAYDILSEAREVLKVAGWVILTRGYDAQSDEITHIGRGMDIAYIQTMGDQ